MFKNKIFSYFFKEFFRIFLIVSFSLSILIWMSQAARLLDLITEYGNSIEAYVKYVLLIFPKIYENTISLSFLITIFFNFYKFENSNEINIYWVSGISKYKIIKLIISFSFIVFILNIILATYLAPLSSNTARSILANSKFNLINSLVKENNFNSPLKDLTIYVEKNNQKGSLESIFIYEKFRTTIAKKGTVYKKDDSFYLELSDGITQEIVNKKINSIKFEKTIFDFSNFSMQNITTPKFSERNIIWIIKQIQENISDKVSDIRKEFNKRIIKPFCIFLIGTLGCFLLYDNKEKINLTKFRILIFCFTVLFLLINEIFLGISSKNFYFSIFYFFLLLMLQILFLISLIKILKFESLKK